MKVLIFLSAVLAVVSAGYHGGYHVPVLDHNGFQLDTPEVAHAKAAHLAAHADAAARSGHGVYAGHAVAPVGYAGHYHGPIHIPVIGPHGVPLDEPAVAHARAAHFAAHADAAARSYGHGHPWVHYRKRRGLLAPVAYAHGHYYGPQHIPVIGPHGVPLDTPEVVAARAHHAAAHAEASARNGDYHGLAHVGLAHAGLAHAGYAHAVAPVAYAGHYGYHGPQHIPVIGPHGVPLDEPAVAHARAAHAAAHAQAAARDHHYY